MPKTSSWFSVVFLVALRLKKACVQVALSGLLLAVLNLPCAWLGFGPGHTYSIDWGASPAQAASYVPNQDEAEAPVGESDDESGESSGEEPSSDEGRIVDFHRDIAPLLRTRCLNCHQGENPKGGFIVFDRESVLAYISPSDIDGSSLWTDYLIQPSRELDSESLIMPPDGPLRPGELALFKLWIEEGAQWPEASSQGALASPSAQGSDQTAESHALLEQDAGVNASAVTQDFAARAFKASGYLHPALVHFPVALLVLAGGCAFLSFFLGARCESMAFHLLWIGALSCLFSSVAGWSFAETRGYTQWSQFPSPESTPEIKAAFAHRWLGIATTAVSITAVLIGMIGYRIRSRSMTNLWLMTTFFLVILVSYTGHKGGELVYGDIFEKIREIMFD